VIIFKPLPPVGAGGDRRRKLYVFGSSVRAAVHASVRASVIHVVVLCFRDISSNLLTDFRQTFVTDASRDRDELIRFWGKKVKGQGHSMTEYIPDFYVSAISPVSVDRFFPNFCHWCISGQR